MPDKADTQFKYHKLSKPSEGVVHVEFHRPEALNAFHRDMYIELKRIFEWIDTQSEVRAVVVSGSGKSFCSGVDIDHAYAMVQSDKEPSRKALAVQRAIKEFQDCINIMQNVNKPIIGVVHGISLGLAIDLISAFDMSYASKDAYLSLKEVQLGMTADIGSLQRLPKIVNNVGWLKEISFSGRVFTPYEAEKQGLVNQVFETKALALQKAIEFAANIATFSPVAMHGIKKTINYSLDHTVKDSLDQVAEFNSFAFNTDLATGIKAVRSKKKPTWEKL